MRQIFRFRFQSHFVTLLSFPLSLSSIDTKTEDTTKHCRTRASFACGVVVCSSNVVTVKRDVWLRIDRLLNSLVDPSSLEMVAPSANTLVSIELRFISGVQMYENAVLYTMVMVGHQLVLCEMGRYSFDSSEHFFL